MRSLLATPALRVDSYLSEGEERTLALDVLDGLTRPFKELPPKHFYDARGSELFERICTLPEYYPTRAERAILEAHASAIVDGMTELVELGSGAADKALVLLGAMSAPHYVPFDVSEAAVLDAVGVLSEALPALSVHGVVGDFGRHLDRIPPRTGPRVVALLGGTIGNFLPGSRRAFLRTVAGLLEPGDRFLLGTDLVKDPAVLEAAYNDAAGVTAEFNRNVLHVINRELGADFDVAAFEHVAFFDRRHEWIEMRLRATRDMRVRISQLELEVEYVAGEEMRTEISAKFTVERLRADLQAAGLHLDQVMTDPEGRFALSLSSGGVSQ